MKVVNGNHQTSISMAKQARLAEKETGKKKGGSIFAGDLFQEEDPIEKRKKEAQRKALKVMMDQYAVDSEIDGRMEESRWNIAAGRDSMEEANAAIQELQKERDELKVKHGIQDDSQEQKDLELIEKGRRVLDKYGSLDSMSKEELTRLAEMGPLTDYQRESLSYADVQDEYRRELNAARETVAKESQSVNSTKQSLLGRKYDMTDASRTSEEMQKRAAKEIAGMLSAEAREHVDEEFRELQEQAEKAAEKKEKQEELLEKARKRKEELESQVEQTQEKVKKQAAVQTPGSAEEQEPPAATSQLTGEQELPAAPELTSGQEEAQKELKKIAQQQKLLEEDLHGMIVDRFL